MTVKTYKVKFKIFDKKMQMEVQTATPSSAIEALKQRLQESFKIDAVEDNSCAIEENTAGVKWNEAAINNLFNQIFK